MSHDPSWHRVSSVSGVNLNSAGSDNTIIIPPGVAKWGVAKLRIFDASISLVTSIATLGLYTGAGGTGTILVTPVTLTSLTSATKFADLTITVTADYQTATTVYLRNVIADGAAATCEAALYIDWMG